MRYGLLNLQPHRLLIALSTSSEMKPLFGFALASVIVIVAYSTLFPSATVRYRLTLAAEVDGKPAIGSGVIEVTYRKNPRLLGASADIVTEVRGEAVSIDLGKRGVVFALLARGKHPRSDPENIIPVLYGLTTGGLDSADIPSVNLLSGRRDLPFELLPPLAHFDDPRNAGTVALVDPGDLAASPVSPVSIGGAQIEIVSVGYWPFSRFGTTGVPVSRGIEEKLQWLRDASAVNIFWRAFHASGYRPNGSIEPRPLLIRG